MVPDAVPPLEVDLEVAAPPAAAFAAWVERTATWWPKGHTISGDPARIVFEPRAGGRIYEVAPDGTEHPWGSIDVWAPPSRLVYRWHLFFGPEEATEVEVTFTASGSGTAVRLTQRGWDALGEDGIGRRERTTAGWAAVTEPYRVLLGAAPNHQQEEP